jgi:hypothetical protein
VPPPLHEFLEEKRPDRPLYFVLCVAAWLKRSHGHGRFRTAEIAAELARAGLPPLPQPSAAVSYARHRGLVAPVGSQLWELTERGAAVVAALPDREAASRASRGSMPH